MNDKDGEFGYFERMKRKKTWGDESYRGDRHGNHCVGRLRSDKANRPKIEVFAFDDPGSHRGKTPRPNQATNECKINPFHEQEKLPRELRLVTN